MAENTKKRSNSFRKFLPNIFFKPRDKSNSKDLSAKNTLASVKTIPSNQYENPNSAHLRVANNCGMGGQIQGRSNDICDRIYENLTTRPTKESQADALSNGEDSKHSSSSTLVSESTGQRNKKRNSKTDPTESFTIENQQASSSARPQVPPKPQNDNIRSASPISEHSKVVGSTSSEYPDVYYHSLEKFSDKIMPQVDQIHTYKDAQSPSVPASVGAEIKKVSTKFLISPKKEAEVRTIQPTRARSFSLEKEKTEVESKRINSVSTKEKLVKKAYNYSAPTSPTPTNHKIPNMPATVSPYGSVKKSMNDAEQKKNSLNRLSGGRHLTLPQPTDQNSRFKTVIYSSTETMEPHHQHISQKEKTRQKVEAFYWQKLKELKVKEDDYLLKQSLNATSGNPYVRASYTNSLRSTPSPRILEPKSCSLPRGVNLKTYAMNQPNQPLYSPFVRETPERRTETSIRTQKSFLADQEIMYRHPEKLLNVDYATVNKVGARQPQDHNSLYQVPKRVSFEENVARSVDLTKCYSEAISKLSPYKDTRAGTSETPPKPPVRLSSVGCANFIQNGKVINDKKLMPPGVFYSIYSESESGSEAGEIQKILQCAARKEDDWHGDGSRVDGGLSDGEASRGPTRGRSSRRDDPRRHTLAGNHLYLHPHHPQHNSMDMERYGYEPHLPEYATVTKYRGDRKQGQSLDPRFRKPPLPRGYQPQSNAMLFDDDPGIMSEVETASTGFRRGGKQRSSLPVVRTPSKTLERPLGLVFLQYRNETKRALLPNEITSIDTVKALFVRSFPKQLSMQYMDSPLVKIYIHDSNKDMFYELEDVRAHLRDIRDRSVLRLFESADIGGGAFPGAVGVGSVAMPAAAICGSGPSSWDQDQSYFSEPEIDSEYHHQHVHKSKGKAPAYYMGTAAPSTLPRGSMTRAYSAAAPPVPADRIKSLPGSGSTGVAKGRGYPAGPERGYGFAPDGSRVPDQLYNIPAHSADGYMSSPERGGPRAPYEEPYYVQFLDPAAGRPTITPIIDEEAPDGVSIEDAYSVFGGAPGLGQAPRPMARPPYDSRPPPVADEMQRLRVEKMERQLANLTGLVQKALQVPGAPAAAPRQDFPAYQTRPVTQDAARYASVERPPKLGKDKFQKSVSFEKSVSFSDDPPDMNSPKQHSPQHSADSKPTKPAIKSSTLPRTSSQERDRLKPAPPPKPAGLASQQMALVPPRTYSIDVNPEFFSQMRLLQEQTHDLRIETRNMRRSTLSHATQMRQLMADTIVKIGELAASFCEQNDDSQLHREEEIYRQDMLLLENDLYELEATVERLRGQAANRETRVNTAGIERIAMVLSKSSKTVADWKLKFPILQETMKIKLNSEMEKVVRKEKLLEEEPERLELALRRCKKLTGTLVTLKRLACVQEQRLPVADGRVSPSSSQSSTFCSTAGPSSEEFASDSTCHTPVAHSKGPAAGGRGAVRGAAAGAEQRSENALDALLDELQTFAKPAERTPNGMGRGDGSLRRLHSYPSGSDTDASPPVRARGHHPPKPPVPERHPELLALAARRAPPPPPPRTTSRSPLASPPEPAEPLELADLDTPEDKAKAAARQTLLEQRHQELLKKQRALQEQYARLQMIQRSGPALPPSAQPDLKKTGSESNLLTKMCLNLAPAALSGSLTQLAEPERAVPAVPADPADSAPADKPPDSTTNKVYETDIL